MNNYSFYAIVDSNKIPIQLVTMNDSYFIYIGNKEFSFDNLCLALYNNEEKNTLSTNIINSYSDIGRNLANKLSMLNHK